MEKADVHRQCRGISTVTNLMGAYGSFFSALAWTLHKTHTVGEIKNSPKKPGQFSVAGFP